MASSNRNESFTRDKLFDLKGHVALVTGGGSGIGLMATQALVANGAKVYITGRTQSKLDRVVELYSHGNDSIIPLQCDVSDKSQIADLVKEVSSREKCLCILVNNAGISGATLQTESGSASEMKQNLFEAERKRINDGDMVLFAAPCSQHTRLAGSLSKSPASSCPTCSPNDRNHRIALPLLCPKASSGQTYIPWKAEGL